MSNDKKQGDLDMSDLGSALPSNASGLSAEDRAGIVNALKNKLQSLAGQHADVLETLSPTVRKRVEVLRKIQVGGRKWSKRRGDSFVYPPSGSVCPKQSNKTSKQIEPYANSIDEKSAEQIKDAEHDEFEAKFHEERAALEAKYQKLYEPLYIKRYDIVNGLVEAEGVADDSAGNVDDDKANEGKGVPEFWLTAMRTNEVLSVEIHERDEDALKYLKDIKWSKLDDPKGFKLEFFFNPNPFFKNSVLTKTYHMIDDDEPILEKAIGTEIEWLAGKCLTQKVLKKKPKKGSKNTKPIMKTETCESFFNFFSPPQVPEDDEEIDEEAAEQLQDLMEQDYDIGSTIRDKIIPHAVSWFTGEAVQEEDFEDAGEDDEEGDEENDDEEDEEDEEDEDDDEEEEEPKARKKPSAVQKKAAGGDGQQVERPPECKQQ